MSSTFYIATLLFMCFVISTTAQSESPGTKCYKNKDLGEYETNIYYCPDPNKPECCEEDKQFTCCEKKTERTLKNQLILWGAVFGVVGVVALAWVCYRKDTYMCEGETLSQKLNRCCGCEKKVKPDEEITLSDLNSANEKGSMPELEQTTAGQTRDHYDIREPVTARQVSPIMPRHTKTSDGGLGNDSDSGRGSTVSVEGAGSGSTPGGVTVSVDDNRGLAGERRPLGEGAAKKRKKKKAKKSKVPQEIREEEEIS